MVPIPTSPILSMTKTLVPAAPTCNLANGFVVPIPKFPLEGIKTNVLLAKIEVVIPELVVKNPINCGVVAVDADTVFGTNPVS